jgi:hypothetical protein
VIRLTGDPVTLLAEPGARADALKKAVAFSLLGSDPSVCNWQRTSRCFLKFAIHPNVVNEYLKKARPGAAGDARPGQQGVLGPMVPELSHLQPRLRRSGRPAIWGTAAAGVIHEGVPPQAAADKALKRISAILAKYPIAQS